MPITLEAKADQPNVIFILTDDLGYGDLGCYDCEDIPTPHVDRLAKEGVRFTASYITNPPCCPSRCALMMGQYGQRFGKYGMSRGLPIPEDRPTLAKFMGENGYVTGQIGKWDVGSKAQGPLQVGFAEVAQKPPKKKGSKYFCKNKEGEIQWLTDYDGDNVVTFIGRHKDKPFFLMHHYKAPHDYFENAERYESFLADVDVPEPDTLWKRHPKFGSLATRGNKDELIPWGSIRYLVGEAMYGGRVSDNWDRRGLVVYCEEFFGDFSLDEDLELIRDERGVRIARESDD